MLCPATGLFLLLVMSAGLSRAMAEVIHLRSGESVKGRALRSKSDSEVLVMDDYLRGSQRSIAWDAVDPLDRKRIRRAWSMSYEALASVLGHRLTLELHDKRQQEARGLIVKDEPRAITLLRAGQEVVIPRRRVLSVVREEMDPRDIWSAPQLVEHFHRELCRTPLGDPGAPTTAERFLIAGFAQSVGELETALGHYEACLADPAFDRTSDAKSALVTVRILLKDEAARQALRRMRTALAQGAYRRVRKQMASFEKQHGGTAKLVQREFQRVEREYTKRRTATLQHEAKVRLPKIIAALIKSRVRAQDTELGDVTKWTRRALPEAAFAELVEQLKKRDDVTTAEARAFWDGRSKSSWRKATYASGTFIVEKPKIKRLPKGTKLPTRDGWWRKASTSVRASWTLAYFVDRTTLFEVHTQPTHRLCPTCNGEGVRRKRLSTGGALSEVCPRCAGARHDRIVRFR